MSEGWIFGSFRLEPKNARLWREEQTIPLQPKHISVLTYLVERHGQLVTKSQLLDAVWRRRYVSEGVLKGCVTELRKALGDDPQRPRYIETVARRGYRFIAEVNGGEGLAGWRPAPPTAEVERRIGREKLLERLEEMWRAARSGKRQLAFVSGEAGIGKSTLIEMFLQRVDQGAPRPSILWGECFEQCGESEALLPLLGAMERSDPSSHLKGVLRARAPTWLAQLPGLLTADERQELQRELVGATPERMLREGCEAIEALAAKTPLLIVLEDLHWSDYATIDFLAALGRRRGRAALLVIGSYRRCDAALRDHPVQRVQQELQFRRLAAEFSLDAFSVAELSTYMDRRFFARLFPRTIAETIHRRTGGHPLFVVNFVDHLVAEGRLRQDEGSWSVAEVEECLEREVPEKIRQMIEQKIARLSPTERDLLKAASAMETEFSAALLAAVLDEKLIDIEAHCETLAQRGVMLASAGVAEWPDGTLAGSYIFRKALYKEVLYQLLPPAYRVDLHLRLGERLELAFGERSSEIAFELARHFEAGRDYTRALKYRRSAAAHPRHRRTAYEGLSGTSTRGLYSAHESDVFGRIGGAGGDHDDR
jgi:predicted ATPase/DNA-binding winged helix-turn-helix (wHTH) protein